MYFLLINDDISKMYKTIYFMKIRSLVAEKLLKQNRLCIFIIFKCIFRYYLIIHVFLAHQWFEYKNIYMELVLYVLKCPITRKMLLPFLTHIVCSCPSNKQIIVFSSSRSPCSAYFLYTIDKDLCAMHFSYIFL